METFDSFKGTPTTCEICGEQIALADKLLVEKKAVHKNCFRCTYCDVPLKIGYCAMEHSFFHRYGPKWFCSDHMLLPPGEKEKKMVEVGKAKPKVPKKK